MSNKHLSYSTLLIASCLALATGCAAQDTTDPDVDPAQAGEAQADDDASVDGSSTLAADASPAQSFFPYGACNDGGPIDLGDLEEIPDPFDFDDVLIQRLGEETELGENIAVFVRLPSTGDEELDQSLVRVVGGQGAQLVMFSSDALVELGHIEESPGKDFYTTFANLNEDTVIHRVKSEMAIAEGEVDELTMLFDGRNPFALTTAVGLDVQRLDEGLIVPLGPVSMTPVSNPTNWGETVLINDPAVVGDPTRTYDTCEQEGDACGPWTFCHLMTEMANEPRTGVSPSEFTQRWLETWLNDQTLNADNVLARGTIQTEIIDPWLAASNGDLDLEKSPFRLLAIVNRLDLRKTSSGGGGYGGGGAGTPQDAGELRFVFGLMRPEEDGSACEPMPFTVIFEYGVPKSGCLEVTDWADQWVALDGMPVQSVAYRNALQALTDQVVVRDAVPSKGNGSALNQLRTNENVLDPTWELREFTLTEQNFSTCDSFIDVPADGLLQPHTVGQTPDDTHHMPTPSTLVDLFIASGHTTVPTNFDCNASPTDPFLGGNSLASLNLSPSASPQGTWFANGSGPNFTDDRHDFSLNTCNGCHTCDTDTKFTHIDPLSPPGSAAQLSGFLTGITTIDTQDNTVSRHFADLDRRYNDLYSVADTLCGPIFPFDDLFIEEVLGLPPVPIFEIEIVDDIFNQRIDAVLTDNPVDPLLADLGHEQHGFVH